MNKNLQSNLVLVLLFVRTAECRKGAFTQVQARYQASTVQGRKIFKTSRNLRLKSAFEHWWVKHKFSEQHFGHELLGRRKNGLSPVGAKTKLVHTRWFVLICRCTDYVILVTTVQYKTRTVVGRPYLVRSPQFIHESMFHTQSVMLSPLFISVERKHMQKSYLHSDIKLR